MPAATDHRAAIATALKEFARVGGAQSPSTSTKPGQAAPVTFPNAARHLFATLGYESDHRVPITSPDQFRDTLFPHYETAASRVDLFVFFFERASRLLKENGVLCFISSNKYFRADADEIPQAGLKPDGWNLAAGTGGLLQRIEAQGSPLKVFVNGQFYYGIKTGLNDAFVVDAATREELIHQDRKSVELIQPWLELDMVIFPGVCRADCLAVVEGEKLEKLSVKTRV